MDINKIRNDFPILKQTIYNKPLVYLDNAATTQKPQVVIDCLTEYYTKYNSNIHRGVHLLSQLATNKYEETRKIVADFINASNEEIIFTKGATESINLVAYSLGTHLKEGDEILISHLEHHANIVPWQEICKRTGAVLKVVPINDKGELILEKYRELLSVRTKIVSITHCSNALGVILPIQKCISILREFEKENSINKIPFLVDASQTIQHIKINVKELDCDFLVASGHKIYAPTGTGFLYGRKDLLEKMLPYQTGGDMILSVSFEETIFNDLPFKFEAGTGNIAGIIGLGTAIKYINTIGLDNIKEYENDLLKYATNELLSIDGLRIIGTSKEKTAVISFVLNDIHPHDIGTFLDAAGIAVRVGHHCAEPTMKRFNIPATTRASFSFYNTKEEVDKLVFNLQAIAKMFE
ncbi:MAG: cysteine desulfurase [Bacteroidetes bacterium]|nr:cysteine desulfurase [Bacteroidota bacterium]